MHAAIHKCTLVCTHAMHGMNAWHAYKPACMARHAHGMYVRLRFYVFTVMHMHSTV